MTKKISQEALNFSKAKRAALVFASVDAKEAIALMVSMGGDELGVNEYLIERHKKESGCDDFRTFVEWKKSGYTVKKGEKSFDVWGSPRKAKAAQDETAEKGDEEGREYKLFPVCSLFNESQVKKIEYKPDECEFVKAEEVQAVFVPVSDFRGAIEHLERIFNCDRHSCVGEQEKTYWCNRAAAVMAKLEGLDCKRAKPEDHAAKALIIEKVQKYLVEAPEPTPPTDPKGTKPKAEGKREDLGNNESVSMGLFPQAGEFLALTRTESKTLKTRAGAVNWLAKRGYLPNGEKIEQETHGSTESTEGEPSPFVMTDYVERQENKRDRLEERAEKAEAASGTAYGQAKDMASVIPFGQPILVGHHSEQRDRRFRDKIHNTFGKSFALSSKADHLKQRANTVGTGGISTNEPEALIKLQKKLMALEKSQTTMKGVNAVIRSSLSDDEKITEIVQAELLSISMARDVLKPDHAGRVGFASYSLSNNSAEIRRTKKRIHEIDSIRSGSSIDFEDDDFSMRIDGGRVCVEFSGGKPSDYVRALLKGKAFKWSPRQGAWVRKVTANAMAEAPRLLSELHNMDAIY